MTLKEYLAERKLTISAFARELGELRETVSYVVNGKRPANGRVLAKILRATNQKVTPAELGHDYK